jgi:hypothetical protein
MLAISRVAAKLAAYQDELISMKLVNVRVEQYPFIRGHFTLYQISASFGSFL